MWMPAMMGEHPPLGAAGAAGARARALVRADPVPAAPAAVTTTAPCQNPLGAPHLGLKCAKHTQTFTF